MRHYWLTQHAYLCVDQHAAVFLDLKGDQYIGLKGMQADALSALVHGCPKRSGVPGNEATSDPDSAVALADRLVEMGLLTREESIGRSATPTPVVPVDGRLGDPSSTPPQRLILRHILNFLAAYLRTFVAVRTRPLESIVRSIRDRKAALPADSSCSDLGALHELTSVFLYLRAFFYTQKDKCLFDSIVLMNFLASYRVYPTFVFGVKTVPFSAHCWVQCDQFVLNCASELAQGYSPIAVI